MEREFRQAVEEMWKVAESLDEKGIGKFIPFIDEGHDLRHGMKAEVLFTLLIMNGTDNKVSNGQIDFLNHVLHVPMTEDNMEGYLKATKCLNETKYMPIIPFFILMDKEYHMNLAASYLAFIAMMAVGFLHEGDNVDLITAARYVSIVEKYKNLIEKETGKKVVLDPMELLKEKDRSLASGLGKIYTNDCDKDEAYKYLISLIDKAYPLNEKDYFDGCGLDEDEFEEFKVNQRSSEELKTVYSRERKYN